MTDVFLLALVLLRPGPPPDRFDVQADLQGLYDEITTLQFVSESDVDLLHDVLYTPDWVFVDAMGQKQIWHELRQQAVRALARPLPDSMSQPIQKLSLVPEGARST